MVEQNMLTAEQPHLPQPFIGFGASDRFEASPWPPLGPLPQLHVPSAQCATLGLLEPH